MTARGKRPDLSNRPEDKPIVFEEGNPFEDQNPMPVIVNLSTDIDSHEDYVRFGAKVCASAMRQYTDRRTANMKDVLLAMRALLDSEIAKLS